jgi:hypothetical protein
MITGVNYYENGSTVSVKDMTLTHTAVLKIIECQFQTFQRFPSVVIWYKKPLKVVWRPSIIMRMAVGNIIYVGSVSFKKTNTLHAMVTYDSSHGHMDTWSHGHMVTVLTTWTLINAMFRNKTRCLDEDMVSQIVPISKT